MEKLLHTKAEVVVKEEDGKVEGVVGSTQVIDRLEEVIEQEGWDLTNYKKNPVILWGHNVHEERPPIGKAVKIWLDGVRKKKLMFDIQFDLKDTFAAEIFRKVKEGFLSTVSVGFLPLESEPVNKDDSSPWAPQRYKKQELLELSFVPVPANPEALTHLKSMGIKPIELKDLYPQETKGVIPYKDMGILPITEGWDGPGETAKAKVQDLEIMAAWFDFDHLSSGNTTYTTNDKAAYKLIHHKADDHKAVFRGVATAMATLLGAKGGIDLPEADIPFVYEHLAQHYQEFEKEPPEYKMVENQVLATLDEEIQTLSLEREDKYQVRLIKKLIVMNKEKPKTPVEKDIVSILKKIDIALDQLKGGEK